MVDFVKLKEEENDDKKKGKKNRIFSFKGFLLTILFFFLFTSIISAITYSVSSKIAVVSISGPILTEKQVSLYGNSISSREISEILRELEKDNTVKAVLIDINSPGGSPVASDEIAKAIESLKKIKPVYSLINDVGASGAFWIAVSTDKIYASSMSTVGSIGVTSAGLGFENFIRDYNISYRKQTSAQFKDIGTPFREPTIEEEEIIQNILENIHNKFVSHVATSRNLEFNYVLNYSTGEIFLGDKAKEIGFIDEIGYYPDVIRDLKNRINVTSEILIVEYKPQLTFFEQISTSASSSFIPNTNSQILLK